MICDLSEVIRLVCFFGDWVRPVELQRLLHYLASNNETRGIDACESMSRRIHTLAAGQKLKDQGQLSNVTWGHPYLTITVPGSGNVPRVIRLEYIEPTKVLVVMSGVTGGDLAGLAYVLRKRELILASLFEIAELAKTGLSAPFRDMVEDGML